MNAFHGPANGTSSHCTVKTTAKKMAKSMVGKSTCTSFGQGRVPGTGRRHRADITRWSPHAR